MLKNKITFYKKQMANSALEIKKYVGNYNDCNEEEAKAILKTFFEAYLLLPEQNTFLWGPTYNYYSYMRNLLLFRQALINKRYGEACHELDSIYENEPIFQPRIRYSLVKLYEEYLR